MLYYITAGESHGKYLSAIIEGMPSGLAIDTKFINKELARRQSGYGRGGRMKIETDKIEITGGVIGGKTTGAPLGLQIMNANVTIGILPQLKRPRPGHADFAGSLKYHEGIREVLERASARETAMRVAVGAVCKLFLQEFGIDILSYVTRIGSVALEEKEYGFNKIKSLLARSKMCTLSPAGEKKMIEEIKKAEKAGDSLGGDIAVLVKGVPVGVGSFVHHERKLDARLAGALMSIQAVKAVQIGMGIAAGGERGSRVHDELFYSQQKGYYRKTNNAGGIEGGMSNGENLALRLTMKPIATLRTPLNSVDMQLKKPRQASFERADVCAVPACGVIAEGVVAFEVARAFCEKFAGDSLCETKRNVLGYKKQIKQ